MQVYAMCRNGPRSKGMDLGLRPPIQNTGTCFVSGHNIVKPCGTRFAEDVWHETSLSSRFSIKSLFDLISGILRMSDDICGVCMSFRLPDS